MEEIQELVAYFVAIGAARAGAGSGEDVAITDKGLWMVDLLTRLSSDNAGDGDG